MDIHLMSSKARALVILIFLAQRICHTFSETLPTKITGSSGGGGGDKQNNPTTSYYRHNAFGPNTYAFGFEINDGASGNVQFRDERRYANGTVQGSYGDLRPDGSMMITRFWADSEHGYLSQSQNIESGAEPKWQEDWPTIKKPSVMSEKPLESAEAATGHDDGEKVNLTSILLPVKEIQAMSGIDLNPPELEKQLINPAVLEVIKGQAPLMSDATGNNNSVGFETIDKFIPAQFPLGPFELPLQAVTARPNETLSAQPIPVKGSSSTTAKEIAKHKDNNLPASKSDPSWYERIIEQARQEYVKSVP